MSHAARWHDLAPRLLTAVVLVAVAGAALVQGGLALLGLVALAGGLMCWELVRMLSPGQPRAAVALGLAAALVLASPYLGLPILLAALLLIGIGGAWLRSGKIIFSAYMVIILAGCFSVFYTRSFFLQHVLWLVSVVVVTDVAGYAVGRIVGGPKFWARLSPKKTWSGTVGGWVAAALVGVIFAPSFGVWVIGASVALAFAAQLGDIAESAIKRRAGIKNSSALLPGHGGLLDRFDGMIAAFALWLAVAPLVVALPGGG